MTKSANDGGGTFGLLLGFGEGKLAQLKRERVLLVQDGVYKNHLEIAKLDSQISKLAGNSLSIPAFCFEEDSYSHDKTEFNNEKFSGLPPVIH